MKYTVFLKELQRVSMHLMFHLKHYTVLGKNLLCVFQNKKFTSLSLLSYSITPVCKLCEILIDSNQFRYGLDQIPGIIIIFSCNLQSSVVESNDVDGLITILAVRKCQVIGQYN